MKERICKYYECSRSNDHIVEFTKEVNDQLSKTLVRLFTHEQLTEFRSKIVEASNHIDNIRDDRKMQRWETHLYTLDGIIGDLHTWYSVFSSDGIINYGDALEISIGGGVELHRDRTLVKLRHKVKYNKVDKLNEALQTLVRFVDALYAVTEIRSPEETISEFESACCNLAKYWDCLYYKRAISHYLSPCKGVVDKGKEIIV